MTIKNYGDLPRGRNLWPGASISPERQTGSRCHGRTSWQSCRASHSDSSLISLHLG